MGCYRYKADTSLAAAGWKAFAVPVFAYGFLFYRRRGLSFYSCIPEKLRPYALLFVGVCSLAAMCAIIYFACKATYVVGNINLDDDMLRFAVRRTRRGRVEPIEVGWQSVTVIGNDDRELSVLTPRGEFRILAKGFSSAEIYDCFRQEFAAKRYKK